LPFDIVVTVLHQSQGASSLANPSATAMTFAACCIPKHQASVALLFIVVALSWHTHLCHAVLFSDTGGTTMPNETFPVLDDTQSITAKWSHLRVAEDRRREQVMGIRSFKPLLCNSNILKSGSVCSSTWSAMFGKSETHSNRIVIPCGVCVIMNHASGTLNLNGGIDIQGKMIIPNEVSIDITTTTMIVQGELIMTSTKPVDGIPNIKVTFVGSSEELFTPIDLNANACRGAATCTAGKKSFVVAGGKVTCMYKLK
jgi:hypothetical protein